METDASDDPIHIRALGVKGVVVETEHLAEVIEEFGWLTARRLRHIKVSVMAPCIR